MTVAVPANTGNARSSTITVSAGGMTRTITVNQAGDGYLPLNAPNGVYILHTNGKIYSHTN